MNRGAEAEREMQREIASDPHNVRAYEDLSLLQFIGGRRAEAERTLAQLAAMHPDAATCTEVARELATFGDPAGAAVWRARARVAG